MPLISYIHDITAQPPTYNHEDTKLFSLRTPCCDARSDVVMFKKGRAA